MRKPGAAAQSRASPGGRKLNQQNRRTQTEETARFIWRSAAWVCRRRRLKQPATDQSRWRDRGHLGPGNWRRFDLFGAGYVVRRTELQHVIRLRRVHRLGKQSQDARQHPVMMRQTLLLVMQHDAQSVLRSLQIHPVIAIQRPQRRRQAHTQRRKRRHIEQQGAATGQSPEGIAASVEFGLHRWHNIKKYSDEASVSCADFRVVRFASNLAALMPRLTLRRSRTNIHRKSRKKSRAVALLDPLAEQPFRGRNERAQRSATFSPLLSVHCRKPLPRLHLAAHKTI